MQRVAKAIAIFIAIVFSFFVISDIFRFFEAPEVLQPAQDQTGAREKVLSGSVESRAPDESSKVGSGSKVIKIGYFEIFSKNVKAAVLEIVSEAERRGGYVISEDLRGGDAPQAVVSIAVPEKDYQQMVNYLKKNYEVITYNLTKQDVSEEYLDLEARLKTAREELEAIESLLSKARTVEEVLKIRSQSREIRTEIAQIEKRISELNERVSYSVITVSVFSPTAIRGERNWLNRTLSEALAVLQSSARKTFLLMAALIPVLFASFVAYLLVLLIGRLINKK